MGNASALAGLLLMFGAASPTSAQPATVEGAYARLSPADARVARALFEAQVTPAAPAPMATRATPKVLTVDQIAAMKQGGQSWGQVFKTLKAQGRVADGNLNQVVARHGHRHDGGVASSVSASYDGTGYGRAAGDDTRR